MRVLAVARRDFDPASFDPSSDLLALVTDLQLLALVGIVDPPRKEAKDAIALCKDAGIRVRMITGDHATTAAAIAGQLGIYGKAMTGAEFAALSDDQLRAEVEDIGVVARVAPEDKVRLVSILKGQGNIVAMTGDGVNDAPALTRADIGVAMGITGTEVTKDAAEMILTDDNFATIVTAVEGGRGLYDNLMKYVRVQMIMLAGFILLFVGAGIFTIANGTPLLPLQILWINFAIDVLLALGLGFDAPTPGLMKRRPRSPDEPVIAPILGVRLGIAGLLIAAGTLAVVAWAEDRYDLVTATTMGLTTISLLHIVAALEWRDPLAERVQPGHDRQSKVQPAPAGGAGAHVPGHDDRWPEPAARHRPARRPPVASVPRRRDRLLRPGRAGQARPPSDRTPARRDGDRPRQRRATIAPATGGNATPARLGSEIERSPADVLRLVVAAAGVLIVLGRRVVVRRHLGGLHVRPPPRNRRRAGLDCRRCRRRDTDPRSGRSRRHSLVDAHGRRWRMLATVAAAGLVAAALVTLLDASDRDRTGRVLVDVGVDLGPADGRKGFLRLPASPRSAGCSPPPRPGSAAGGAGRDGP